MECWLISTSKSKSFLLHHNKANTRIWNERFLLLLVLPLKCKYRVISTVSGNDHSSFFLKRRERSSPRNQTRALGLCRPSIFIADIEDNNHCEWCLHKTSLTAVLFMYQNGTLACCFVVLPGYFIKQKQKKEQFDSHLAWMINSTQPVLLFRPSVPSLYLSLNHHQSARDDEWVH